MARGPELLDPVELHEFEQRMRPEKPGDLVPSGERLMARAEGLFGVVTAQRVQIARDEPSILRNIAARAAAAGEDWYYRYQVKKKGGGIDWIEGPSIVCTDNVAQLFKNCEQDVRVLDEGAHYMVYARFVDHENGYAITRAVPISKGAIKLGGDDEERRKRMAASLGQSFAMRNAVHHGIPFFVNYAFEQAKQNLVERVGKKLPEYRARCLERLAELGVPIKRVEGFVGRVLDQWLAPDVARVIAEIKAVTEGMATIEDIWPAEIPPEPRRTPTDVPFEEAPKGEPTQHPHAHPEPAASAPPSEQSATTDAPSPWLLPEGLIGQDSVINTLKALFAKAASEADIDAIKTLNAERIAKITGLRRSEINVAERDARERMTQP
jgi:hypothetical protein